MQDPTYTYDPGDPSFPNYQAWLDYNVAVLSAKLQTGIPLSQQEQSLLLTCIAEGAFNKYNLDAASMVVEELGKGAGRPDYTVKSASGGGVFGGTFIEDKYGQQFVCGQATLPGAALSPINAEYAVGRVLYPRNPTPTQMRDCLSGGSVNATAAWVFGGAVTANTHCLAVEAGVYSPQAGITWSYCKLLEPTAAW